MKSKLTRMACSAALLPAVAMAQISDNTIKIGVLTDMSGVFADFSGNGSVEAAKMAVEKLGGKIAGKPVEVVFADHQNKVDVGATIARRWFERDGIDVIMDVPHTAIALAVVELAKTYNKAALFSSTATAALTGVNCSPNHIMWTWDSWAYTNNMGKQIVKAGGDTWFILTADYAFGHALERDVENVINASGGKVLGKVRHPLGTQDFSAFLVQAQASKAKVLGLANGGADTANAIKQAIEFGMTQSGTQMAGLVMNLPDVRALGLERAQGMYVNSVFYWDRNDQTRAFAKEISARNKGIYPEAAQAGVYSAVLHYAKAVESAGTDEGAKVISAMKAIPTDDPLFDKGRVREDGRKIHPVYLLQVKKPSESKGPYDFYRQISMTPAEQAFQPIAEAGCPLVKR